MINAYQETIFFHYILGNQLFLNVSKSDFFTNPVLKELFDIAKEHALRYKDAPSKDQMIALIRVKGLSEKYSEEVLEGLYNSKQLLSEYGNEWLENNVGPWIQVRNLDNVMRKAIAFMKTTEVNAENASEVVEKIRNMLSSETAVNFSFDIGSDFYDAARHLQTRLARTSSGYEYIDLCLKGGFWKGSLITFLSGPKAGKCVTGDTQIKIKNKSTGEIKHIKIGNFHKLQKLSAPKDKKFIEVFNVENWEVETDTGWEDIIASGKTIKYKIFQLELENGLTLNGADNHIVINSKNEEMYLYELNENDYIKTKNGISKVKSKSETTEYENMYDIEVDSINHTYYTNDILSHNSTWLGNLALKSSQMGNNTAYVTFELQEEIVNMRIGANQFNVPLDDYEEWAKDQDRLKQKIQQAKQAAIKPVGALHVKEFGASTCSVNDLRNYLLKAEEVMGIKFDNIFVDYINIMKNWRNPNTENTYMKIKQIAEDLRAMAMEEKWAVITATQTNRGGWEGTDLNITDVSESAALLHTVDVLFGIITNAEMKARGEYYLKCLANRVSGYENTKKRYTINWKYSRVEEDKNSPIQDMDYIITGPRPGQPLGGGSLGQHNKHSTSADIHTFINQSTRPEQPTEKNKIESKDVNITGNELFNFDNI